MVNLSQGVNTFLTYHIKSHIRPKKKKKRCFISQKEMNFKSKNKTSKVFVIFFRSKHSQTKENWLEYKPNPQSMELKYNTLFVLNETMTALGAQVHWCSCNILSKRDHAIAVGFARDSATVFT